VNQAKSKLDLPTENKCIILWRPKDEAEADGDADAEEKADGDE